MTLTANFNRHRSIINRAIATCCPANRHLGRYKCAARPGIGKVSTKHLLVGTRHDPSHVVENEAVFYFFKFNEFIQSVADALQIPSDYIFTH